MMYHCLRGIKSNAMFIGPSGCGKTHIWRCLKEVFPDRIEIADISNLNQDGWKGSLKWKDLLRSPIFRSGNHSILILDEADKMLAPKFSHDENVSQNIQSEGLTLMEGARVEVKNDSVIHEIDTAKISFILCGAFSNKAHALCTVKLHAAGIQGDVAARIIDADIASSKYQYILDNSFSGKRYLPPVCHGIKPEKDGKSYFYCDIY